MDSRPRELARRPPSPSPPTEGPRRSSRGASRSPAAGPAPWAGKKLQGFCELMGGGMPIELDSVPPGAPESALSWPALRL
jgi:hypothetical protein